MITVKEASRMLDVSESFVRDLIARGKLKARKFGNQWAVDEVSVNERRMKMQGLRNVRIYTSQMKEGWFTFNREPEEGLFDKFVVHDVPECVTDEQVIEMADKKITHMDTKLIPPMDGRLDSPGIKIGGCTWEMMVAREEF